jgi:hypothetical protein
MAGQFNGGKLGHYNLHDDTYSVPGMGRLNRHQYEAYIWVQYGHAVQVGIPPPPPASQAIPQALPIVLPILLTKKKLLLL